LSVFFVSCLASLFSSAFFPAFPPCSFLFLALALAGGLAEDFADALAEGFADALAEDFAGALAGDFADALGGNIGRAAVDICCYELIEK
jgi:hypothetical protein